MRSRMRNLLLIVSALLAACGSPSSELNLSAQEASELTQDNGLQSAETKNSPLEQCSEQPRDPAGLALYFENSRITTWVAIDRNDLLESVERRSFNPAELGRIHGDPAIAQNVELDRFVDPAPIAMTEFERFIVPLWENPGEPGGVAGLVGVADDDSIVFLGDCQQDATELFQIWKEESVLAEVQKVSDVEALTLLVSSEQAQQEVLAQWYGEPIPDPTREWQQRNPVDRVLDTSLLDPTIFDDLYPVVLELSLPRWWQNSTDVVLCPFIPGVGWGPECIGSVDPANPITLHSFTNSQGQLELHLSDSEITTTSIARIGTLEGLRGKGTSVLVSVGQDLASVDELARAANGLDVADGDLVVPAERGLPEPAETIDEVQPTTEAEEEAIAER